MQNLISKDTISQNPGIAKRFATKGVFPYQMAFTLLIPFRNIFLSPKKLIKRLELKDDFKVLELGPGPGYFSIPVARSLPFGKLVLADIQQEMLDHAKKRISKRAITNVEYHLCNGENFNFPDNSFSRIYMVTVIGEVENKVEYFDESYRMLTKNGILSITELAGDPDKLKIEDVKELAYNSNFKFHNLYGNDKNYTINFKK